MSSTPRAAAELLPVSHLFLENAIPGARDAACACSRYEVASADLCYLYRSPPVVTVVSIGLAGRIMRLEDWQIGQGERLARLEGKLDRF